MPGPEPSDAEKLRKRRAAAAIATLLMLPALGVCRVLHWDGEGHWDRPRTFTTLAILNDVAWVALCLVALVLVSRSDAQLKFVWRAALILLPIALMMPIAALVVAVALFDFAVETLQANHGPAPDRTPTEPRPPSAPDPKS